MVLKNILSKLLSRVDLENLIDKKITLVTPDHDIFKGVVYLSENKGKYQVISQEENSSLIKGIELDSRYVKKSSNKFRIIKNYRVFSESPETMDIKEYIQMVGVIMNNKFKEESKKEEPKSR